MACVVVRACKAPWLSRSCFTTQPCLLQVKERFLLNAPPTLPGS